MPKVTDPDLLAELNGPPGKGKVTDATILSALNGQTEGGGGLWERMVKPFTEAAELQSDPEFMKGQDAGARFFAQGIPVVGAAVPSTETMHKLEESDPAVAGGMRTMGGIAGAAPAFLAAGPSLLGAVTAGAGLSAADKAARGGTPADVALAGATGGGAAALGGAPAALLTKSAAGAAPAVASKAQAILKALTPGGESSAVALPVPGAVARQLPERIDKLASGFTTGGLGHLVTHKLGIPTMGEVGALGFFSGHENPFINAILRALAPTVSRTPAAINPVASSLARQVGQGGDE